MSKENGNALMRKTKQQLVEIILRKDDVEKKLQEELNIYKENLCEDKSFTDKEIDDIVDNAEQVKLQVELDKLREKFNTCIAENQTKDVTIEEQAKEIADLNIKVEGFHESCDNCVTECANLAMKVIRWKARCVLTIIIAIIAILIAIF